MDVLLLLLIISLVFIVFIGIFLYWAIFSGQYENLESNGESILQDNDTPTTPTSKHHS
ncbi:cbb3-type cytochrome oxidase assembly protein CcoS [Brackiella oedipodis]|uniref:cbb3-type cytochrome oxidase assembly protein CcoS n=1 Tax=Brackiella oedipodis TaxID=124225 RepID=UPI0009FFA8F3|nr:cbb3-type cytochrome oxidase assembly protein CcoS [Brackiella oedipodis]